MAGLIVAGCAGAPAGGDHFTNTVFPDYQCGLEGAMLTGDDMVGGAKFTGDHPTVYVHYVIQRFNFKAPAFLLKSCYAGSDIYSPFAQGSLRCGPDDKLLDGVTHFGTYRRDYDNGTYVNVTISKDKLAIEPMPVSKYNRTYVKECARTNPNVNERYVFDVNP